MAAMKPRTGDGPMEVTKEGRGIVMRVPLEGGGRLVVELNATPRRLELDWRQLRSAKDMGVKFAINPDAHSVDEYAQLRYGIGAARKGWLTRHDVVNTLDVGDLLALFRSRRPR